MDGMVREGGRGARQANRAGMAMRRRSWSATEKAAIVAESYEVGAKVMEVAARHGLNESILLTWRRRAMEPRSSRRRFQRRGCSRRRQLLFRL